MPSINYNATYYEGSDLYGAIPSPAPAEYFSPSNVTVVAVANIRYYQRVYSSGLSAWCYYDTLNGTDPSPSPNSTNPPWTGSISDHQILAKVPVF
jgi:hypothetical protein